MSKPIGRNLVYVPWLHELLFSVYLSFLVVSAHEGGGQDWATRLVLFFVSHGYAQATRAMEDYRVDLADFSLVWLSAILIFLLLRLFPRFPFKRIVLNSFAGLVALAGFPLASLYQRNGNMISLEVGLVIVGSCFILWAYRKRPVSSPVAIALLILYFVLWSSIGGGYHIVGSWFALWPAWRRSWPYLEHLWLVYPLLGFCSTLLWAAYFRQSEANEQSGSSATA